MWDALKQLAQRETQVVNVAQAIKRVKAVARKEGALDLPERALRFYAQEYCDMVNRRVVR
jgi:hypothetical protein